MPSALERSPQRVAQRDRKARARLGVVLQVLQLQGRRQVKLLPGEDSYCFAWS